MFGQLPPELQRHAFLRGDVPIDRLLAGPERCTFLDQPVADLLRRPTVLDQRDDLISKLRVPDQLTMAGAPTGGLPMRIGVVVAIIARQALIAEPVPLALVENGGFRSLQNTRNLTDRGIRQFSAFDLITVLDAQSRVNRSHGRLLPLNNHLFSDGSRT